MNDNRHDLILATARELYGRLVVTHLTHEKQRLIWTKQVCRMSWINISLAAVTTLLAVLSAALKNLWVLIPTALLAAATVSFAIWQANYDPAAKEAQHRVAAKELLWLREQFLLFITECMAGSAPDSQLDQQLRLLTRELTAVYKFAPNTSPEAYEQAMADIRAGHFTFSTEEIDAMLPCALRLNQ